MGRLADGKKFFGLLFLLPVAAAAVAVGHHFYHASKDGRAVGDRESQTWTRQISQGLSTLVKTILEACIGIAVVQMFWHNLRKKTVPLKTADSLFQMSILDLWRLPAMWKFSVIMWISIVCARVIGISVVFPPATLRIVSNTDIQQQSVTLPRINLTDNGPATGYFVEPQGVSTGQYYQPSLNMRKLALLTASSARIQPFQPPYQTMSYTHNFFAPSIECHSRSIYNTDPRFQNGRGTGLVYYGSALLGKDTIRDQMDYMLSNATAITNTRTGSNNYKSNYQANSACSGQAQYYDGVNVTGTGSPDDRLSFWMFFSNKSALSTGESESNAYQGYECILYNSSYQVSFSFRNGVQDTDVVKVEQHHPVPPRFLPCNDNFYYQPNCTTETHAFQAVFHSMTLLLMGWVEGELTLGDGISGPTKLWDTSLMYTKEFKPWRVETDYTETPIVNLDESPGLAHISNMTLGQAAEQLMQNITLSLFSIPRFLQTNPTPMLASVSYDTIIWRYDPRNLIITYCTIIGFTVLVAATGAKSVWDNGRGYENGMSTVIRASRNGELDQLIHPRDTDGAHPVPDYLQDAKIRFERLTIGHGQRYALAVQKDSDSSYRYAPK